MLAGVLYAASSLRLNGTSFDAAQQVEHDVAEDSQSAGLIDGKAIAQTIRKEVAAQVAKLREKYGKVLTLGNSFTLLCTGALGTLLSNALCTWLTESRRTWHTPV